MVTRRNTPVGGVHLELEIAPTDPRRTAGSCVASDAGEGQRGPERERRRSRWRVVSGQHMSSFQPGMKPGLRLALVGAGHAYDL